MSDAATKLKLSQLARRANKADPLFAAKLVEQHRNIERVLILIRLQVDSLRPLNSERDLSLIDNALAYMAGFPTEIHDPSEDILFDHLVMRAPSAATLRTYLLKQQGSLSHLQSALQRHVKQARAGDLEGHAQIKHSGVAYCLEYADHIHNEEKDLLPSARRALLPEDWDRVDRQVAEKLPHESYPALKSQDSLYDFLTSGEFRPAE